MIRKRTTTENIEYLKSIDLTFEDLEVTFIDDTTFEVNDYELLVCVLVRELVTKGLINDQQDANEYGWFVERVIDELEYAEILQ